MVSQEATPRFGRSATNRSVQSPVIPISFFETFTEKALSNLMLVASPKVNELSSPIDQELLMLPFSTAAPQLYASPTSIGAAFTAQLLDERKQRSNKRSEKNNPELFSSIASSARAIFLGNTSSE